MNKPLKVGDTLYALNVGNMTRGREQVLTLGKVVRVGRSLFDFKFEDHWRPMTFHIHNWTEKTEYCASYCLYESPQEWEDEKRSKILCDAIYKAFEYGNNRLHLTLDKLETINKIILGIDK
jgi:hypothetical protein